MKFIRSTIFMMISALLFLFSICLVLAGLMALDQSFTAKVIHAVTRPILPAPYYVVAGLVGLLLSVVVYNLAGQSSDSSGIFTFAGEKGPIDISLHALEDYIAKHFARKPVVNSVKTRVSASRDRRKLRVRASISVWSEQNLRGAGEAVQQEITRCLKEGLGLDNVETVLVSVDKIIASKSARPIPSEAPSDEIT
jgi:hypothetical protein